MSNPLSSLGFCSSSIAGFTGLSPGSLIQGQKPHKFKHIYDVDKGHIQVAQIDELASNLFKNYSIDFYSQDKITQI